MQTFYPGWNVEPWGEIEPMDDVFQRVRLPAGVQSVTLRFAPDLLKVCLYFALIGAGWLTCVCFMSRMFRAENRNME
jgi:uncharacterized membrane protein YfhO